MIWLFVAVLLTQDGVSGSGHFTPPVGMNNSGLRMEANRTLGKDMFKISSGECGQERSMEFGFFKIEEVDSSGDVPDQHICYFNETSKINCTETASAVEDYFSGLDEDGNFTEIPYIMNAMSCNLSSCGGENAELLVTTYIAQDKGYLCQPNCTADYFLSTPVFKGTAKWDIRINNWNFTVSADGLQIFFHLAGKKKQGGKRFRPTKKHLPDFDPNECAYTPIHIREEMKAKHNDPGRQTKPLPENTGSHKRSSHGHGHGNVGSTVETSTDETSTEEVSEAIKNTRDLRGKCRSGAAHRMSFSNEPEDQDAFVLTEEGGSGVNDTMSFRMFPLAVLDNSTVINATNGFEGPTIEEIADGNGGSGKSGSLIPYIKIKVPVFHSTFHYDPTGDMSEYGGTLDESDVSLSSGAGADYVSPMRAVAMAFGMILFTLIY